MDEQSFNFYLVSLPIGNMHDISARAVDTLQSVDLILAEDTRQIKKFARQLELSLPTIKSYREQNHEQVAPAVIQSLQEGKRIALVADRGTPTISDPGYKLVKEVQEAGFEVTNIPGPVAATTALAISGLPTDRFSFLGFLPRKAKKQQDLIWQFAELPATFIVYESPYRLQNLLENMQAALGENVQVALCKELTKLHERVIRGSVSEVLTWLSTASKAELKGEWVVLGRK